MNNVKPATVIVLDGLRVRLPPLGRTRVPGQWLRQSTIQSKRHLHHTSRKYSTTTSSTSNPVPYPRSISQSQRLLPYQSPDEEVAQIIRTAEPGRLYELLRIEGVKGRFERVQAYAECLMTKYNEAPNLRMYSALILANAHEHGSIASVLDFVRQLRDDGFDLDGGCCHDIMKVIAVHPDYLLRTEILNYMQEKWLQLSEYGRHDLVAGFLREDAFEMALDEIDAMKGENIKIQPWLHDMAIYTLAEKNELDDALRLLKTRIEEGDANISGPLWNYLLDVGSAAMHHDMASYVWRKRVQTKYTNPPLGVCLNVLTAAARRGDADLATDVFKALGDRQVVFEHQHYEMLVETYVNAGDMSTAFSVLCVMQESKATPDDRTTRTIFKSLSKSPSLIDKAFTDLRALHESGKIVPTAAMNVLIEAAIFRGNLELAVEFYKVTHEICVVGANISTFNILLRGCNHMKRKDLALLLASELLALGLKPNRLTYDRMLLICMQEEDHEDGLQYYQEMRLQGLQPRDGTILFLIKVLTQKNDERVFEVLEQMEGMSVIGLTANVSRIKRWVKTNWKGEEHLIESF